MDENTRSLLHQWLAGIVPLQALGIELVWTDPDHWHISAPLPLNRNHMGTGFGGSIATVATLAGWIQTSLLLDDPNDYDIVIANSSVTFQQPVTTDFIATAKLPSSRDVTRFQKSARERQQGALTVHTEVFCNTQPAAQFSGRFVAQRKPG
ncbi:MAG: hypothetical protein HKN70_03375 [Gammaproteobacteria bacterium]|nr:hypothetical protein [Gammaproteobacteria bacterium]